MLKFILNEDSEFTKQTIIIYGEAISINGETFTFSDLEHFCLKRGIRLSVKQSILDAYQSNKGKDDVEQHLSLTALQRQGIEIDESLLSTIALGTRNEHTLRDIFDYQSKGNFLNMVCSEIGQNPTLPMCFALQIKSQPAGFHGLELSDFIYAHSHSSKLLEKVIKEYFDPKSIPLSREPYDNVVEFSNRLHDVMTLTKNPNLSDEQCQKIYIFLDIIEQSENEYLQVAQVMMQQLAQNPALPTHIQKEIMNKNNWIVQYLAKNPSLHKEFMQTLARHPAGEVRSNLANNPYLPNDIMERLAKDKNDDVRLALARREYSLNDNVQSMLVNDCDHYIQHVLIKRADTTVESLKHFSMHENSSIRCAVAESRNITEEIGLLLAEDDCWSVRRRLTENEYITRAVMEKLLKDKDFDIRGGMAQRRYIPDDLREIFYQSKYDESLMAFIGNDIPF